MRFFSLVDKYVMGDNVAMDDKGRQRCMKMALTLARKGAGYVAPNPMVGAVIVKGDQIIGRGYHQRFGQAHAEINALNDCAAGGRNPSGATMFVILEPCCHHGKTGPCTEAIAEAGVAGVEIATLDDFAQVAGKGAAWLEQRGITVRLGCCRTEARRLNAGFFKLQQSAEPAVTLKWAQSIDGILAWPEGAGKRWISNDQSRRHAHHLRSQCGAVLVGVGTILADDPLLNVRLARKLPQPLRVVLDSKLRIPLDCQLAQTARQQPVLVCTLAQTLANEPEKAEMLEKSGCEVISVPDCQGRPDLSAVLGELGQRGICDLLVEGGPTILAAFVAAGRVDRVMVYVAPVLIGSPGASGQPKKPMLLGLPGPVELADTRIRRFGQDMLIEGWAGERT